MTQESRRVQLAHSYLLHQRPYRDTGRILEVFTREHGRLSLFARGVQGPRAQLAAVLQPFQLLLVSFSWRGEAGQLTAAECAGYEPPVPAPALMSGFYLSELILKLTTRHDPAPELFDEYQRTLAALRAGSLELCLRVFEKRLLEAIGYGLDLTTCAETGAPIEAHAHYHFRPGQGMVTVSASAPEAICGASLLALASEQLSEATLADARRLLRAALAQCLEGRPLMTRAVASSVARRRSRTSGPEPRQ
jgi:DNA repair protein RecO (recombination protein O)